MPPAGIWPLGIAGLGLLAWRVRGQALGARVAVGMSAGSALYAVTLSWIEEFTAPGYVLLVLLEASFLAGAVVLAGRRSALALAPALVLTEWARASVPFGGLPMGGVALGQAVGPLGPVARLGGALFVAGLAAAVGAAFVPPEAATTRGHRLLSGAARGAVALAVSTGLLIVARVAPDGGPDRAEISVAAVQGGGQRGFRAVDTDPADVFTAHLAATELLDDHVDLLLWPEDVIDVEGRVERTPEGRTVSELARALEVTLVGGSVEGAGARNFRNVAAVWWPDGRVHARYEKVHRVPFGEWVPHRGFFDRFADLSAVPRDAIPGTGNGVVTTPHGPAGVVISYEVFYADRARDAIGHGGQVLLAPTNTASYRTSQVPEQELAAVRLRAWETGRWVVQAAPTGHSLIATPNAEIVAETRLDEQAVVGHTVRLRTGTTPYVTWGDVPVLAGSGLWLVAGLLLRRKRAKAAIESAQAPTA